jgi:hypothetical protein
MMHNKFALFALAAVMALPAAPVDSTLLNMIGPEAGVVAGLDFDKVRESPFGQFMLRQMNVSEDQMAKMAEHLGFDPRRDLREVLVVGSGTAAKHGLVLVRGAFDQTRLTGLAGLTGAPMTTYKGTTMFAPKAASGDGPWAAIVPGGLALGDESSLKSALDRAANSPKPDAALVARIQSASDRNDAWLLTTVSPSSFAPNMKGKQAPGAAQGSQIDNLLKGELIQSIENVTMGVRFGANVVLSGEALMRNERDASALGDVMKFLLGMAASAQPQGANLLNSFQTAAEGRTLRFSLSAPQSDFEKMLEPGPRRMRTRPVSR